MFNSHFRSTHTRSKAALKKRNKKGKDRKKQKKKLEYARNVKDSIQKDEIIRNLESEKALLSRALKNTKSKKKLTVPSRYSLPRSILQSTRNKNVGINQSIQIPVTEFRKDELELFDHQLGEGAYGKVCLGRLSNFQQTVAVKEISGKSSQLNAYVESKIMLTLNGYKNLPLFYGWVKPNFILIEFIGKGSTPSPTLKELLFSEISNEIDWIAVLVDISLTLKFIHDKGLLHNDLHSKNVLIRDKKFVKVIDFGKATLMDDPVVYNITPGSPKQQIYNERHKHLAYELRNVPNSAQTIQTDIFSLGFIMQLVSEVTKNEKLSNISIDLLVEDPSKRPLIPHVVRKCELLRRNLGN